MTRNITADLDKLLATLCRFYSDEGEAREVALLGHANATLRQTTSDNWNGGIYGFTVYLEVPEFLVYQLGKEIAQLEQKLTEKASELTRLYENEFIEAFKIVTELTADPDWKEKAKSYVSGKGLTNQDRARSDNLAPRMSDGLLFRSQPEINLYKAFKGLGVTFAPLPVFIRGGQTYRRIEPDFVVLKDGMLMIVEVDRDTVHRESPLDAHNRTTMLAHEGAHIERVNADECGNEEKAKVCALRLLAILNKLHANH